MFCIIWFSDLSILVFKLSTVVPVVPLYLLKINNMDAKQIHMFLVVTSTNFIDLIWS